MRSGRGGGAAVAQVGGGARDGLLERGEAQHGDDRALWRREQRGVVAGDGVGAAEQRGATLLLERGAEREPCIEAEPLARVAPAAAEGPG